MRCYLATAVAAVISASLLAVHADDEAGCQTIGKCFTGATNIAPSIATLVLSNGTPLNTTYIIVHPTSSHSPPPLSLIACNISFHFISFHSYNNTTT
jgi:hypothetical protein